jgi:hypothetical protein
LDRRSATFLLRSPDQLVRKKMGVPPLDVSFPVLMHKNRS